MKDVLIRTLRSAIQAALAVVMAHGIGLTPDDWGVLRLAAIAGLMAAVTAVHGMLEQAAPPLDTRHGLRRNGG